MRRTIAWLGALLVAAAFTIGVATPAHAATTKTRCFYASNVFYGDDYPWCLTMAFSNDTNGQGIYVYWVEKSCRPTTWEFGWDHPAVDGHTLKLVNADTGNVALTWYEATSNVDTSDDSGHCNATLEVNHDYPNAHQMQFRWDVTLQIDNTVDQNPPIATISAYNN